MDCDEDKKSNQQNIIDKFSGYCCSADNDGRPQKCTQYTVYLERRFMRGLRLYPQKPPKTLFFFESNISIIIQLLLLMFYLKYLLSKYVSY